jgi:hypothetical protein
MVTMSGCVVRMLDDASATLIAGGGSTVTEPVPVEVLYATELAESGV